MTPSGWTTSTEVSNGGVRMTLMLTTDAPGGVREYRPYLDVDLDYTHAVMLFGELGLALEALDERRKPAND